MAALPKPFCCKCTKTNNWRPKWPMKGLFSKCPKWISINRSNYLSLPRTQKAPVNLLSLKRHLAMPWNTLSKVMKFNLLLDCWHSVARVGNIKGWAIKNLELVTLTTENKSTNGTKIIVAPHDLNISPAPRNTNAFLTSKFRNSSQTKFHFYLGKKVPSFWTLKKRREPALNSFFLLFND